MGFQFFFGRSTNFSIALFFFFFFFSFAQSEITLLQNLHHPRIVKYVDSFKTDDSLYIVLEYVLLQQDPVFVGVIWRCGASLFFFFIGHYWPLSTALSAFPIGNIKYLVSRY
jgi:hypothetical protein